MREDRFLTGGIDSDSAPHAIEENALLNAVNVRAVISKTQNSTDIQFIEGNEEVLGVSSLLQNGTNTLLGKCVDAENLAVYFFFHNSINEHRIIKLFSNGTASVVFENGYVTGGLNWSASMFISCEAANGFLLFTEPTNGARYINLSYPYAAAAPFDASIISLITEPPHVPLTAVRDDDPTASTTIQFDPLQFTYRIITRDNFQSVLAPYSLTCLPVRESEIASSPTFGNVIDIAVDVEQKFPINWKTVELVVRYPNNNTFEVIKQYSYTIAADNTAITNHNNGTPLTFTWEGESVYTLDEATVAKLFDNIPLTSEQLELAANRLLLANNVEGYDPSLIAPNLTLTPHTYTTDMPNVTALTSYMLWVQDADGNRYYAIIFRTGGFNYLMPGEFNSKGFLRSFISTTNLRNIRSGSSLADWVYQDLINIPEYVHLKYCKKLNETGDPELTTTGDDGNNPPPGGSATDDIRTNIVNEVNNQGIIPATVFEIANWEFLDFNLIDDPDEYGTAGQSRTYYPNTEYKVGIQYFDDPLRKPGVQLYTTLTMPNYGVVGRTLTDYYTATLSNSIASIPSWAKYFCLTLSKNQKSERVINFVPGLLRVAFKNGDGEFKYMGYSYIFNPPSGYDLYGIAVPVGAISQYEYGYAYAEGDMIELSGEVSGVDTLISTRVRDFQAGYVIAFYDSSADYSEMISDGDENVFINVGAGTVSCITSGFNHRQARVLATIRTGEASDNMYEVAKFGLITNNQYDHFFDTGNLTTTIYGDAYTQKRISSSGALTGYAQTTYELNNLVPVNDTGRVTLTDRIGQQSLPTAIRWSNTFIPGTATNGYATFDPLDYKIIEQTAGEINGLVLTTKGIQEGGQLLILCSNGSFTALIDKQQVVGSDQETAFIATAPQVLGSVNPLKGKWGCASPRSITEFQGSVFWVDWTNRDVLEFNAAGANPVSQYKCTRLWNELLSRITFASDAKKISASINPYTSELMISVPAPNPSTKTVLPTTTLQNPLDCYYNDLRTYVYNWQLNKWVCSWENGNEFVTVGETIFGWSGVKVYQEFVGDPGLYNETQRDGMIVVPFNKNYPVVKAPLSVRASTSRYPDTTWVSTDGMIQGQGVAPTTTWKMREGDGMAAILRDRLSNNASGTTTWNAAGINGNRLKGKSINVVMIWNGATGAFYCSSVGLESAESSGHK